MNDWLHDLPIIWMAFVVFGFTYIVAAVIYTAVMVVAIGKRARSFKAVSPGMLPPLGIIFGLFVAFTAAQVWNDTERAQTAINREASSLRTIIVLASSFPGDSEARLRILVRDYIQETVTTEWPMLARQSATLTLRPPALAEALKLTLSLIPSTEGQKIAQREMTTAIENALDARRQRILISRSQVNLVKWSCLLLQAVCALVAIAMVHSDDRLASAITMAIFATGVAASVLLILSHDRPFTGEVSIGPGPLLQVEPETGPTPPTNGNRRNYKGRPERSSLNGRIRSGNSADLDCGKRPITGRKAVDSATRRAGSICPPSRHSPRARYAAVVERGRLQQISARATRLFNQRRHGGAKTRAAA